MMRYAALMLLLTLAVPLMAQVPPLPPGTETPDPSAEKESFVIQPGEVDKGAQDFAIRMVSNEPAGFSNSSSKPPNVTFSSGVTLKPGSFQILNQNEAECRIDVDNDAVGTCEVRIEMFSVNGSTILSTLRGTLGIKGTTAVSGSQAQVGAESVKLVQVNVSTPQTAGVIVISGEIAGSVSITAPTGTNFAQAPVALIDSGDINSPALAQANTVFNFTIGNPSLDNITVRVTDIQYNTQLFGVAGGNEGDLVCEVTGGALSNQTALVINAFTAKTEIAGSNDNNEPVESNENNGSESSNSTNEGANATGTPTSGNVTTPNRRNLDGDNNNNRNNRENRNNRNNTGGNRILPGAGGGSGSVNNRPPPPRNFGNAPPLPAPGPSGGRGGARNAGGASNASMGGTGSMKPGNQKTDYSNEKKELPTRVLEITPGLHFCDSDFNPVSALVLDKSVNDEAGGRVWIVLKLKDDKHSDKIETATVKLTLGGVTRELKLTETGKNTGEFRCSKEGVLIVANENPNSNEIEKEPEPPKPRYPK